MPQSLTISCQNSGLPSPRLSGALWRYPRNRVLDPRQVGVSRWRGLPVAGELEHAVAFPLPIVDVAIGKGKDAAPVVAAGGGIVPRRHRRGGKAPESAREGLFDFFKGDEKLRSSGRQR